MLAIDVPIATFSVVTLPTKPQNDICMQVLQYYKPPPELFVS